MQATKKPHNYHKTVVWQKDDRIRKSPLKFYVYYYSELSGDCQVSIFYGIVAAVCCFLCYFMAHEQLVLGTKRQKTAEQGLYDKGERPDALIDWPVDALDYELVDIFNWQEEAAGMISQMEFVRRVDVQTETIERYVRDGLLVPDLMVPMSEHRTFKYFKEETLQKYAQQYGWSLIDDSNRKVLLE